MATYSTGGTPIACTDNYQYFKCHGGVRYSIQVLNNGAAIGFGRGDAAVLYPAQDDYFQPSLKVAGGYVDEIRYRNAVPGQQAQIAISVETQEDLPDGPLGVSLVPSYVTVQSVGEPTVQSLGLVGDGLVDDYATLQQYINARAGSEAFIPDPPVEYRITQPLSIPQGTSLRGKGVTTVIHADHCDGLALQLSNDVSPIRIEKLHLRGDAATTVGIRAMGDGDQGRVSGITFTDLFLENFYEGMHFRALWDSAISHVTILNVYRGIVFQGQCIHNVIDEATTIICGTGASANSTGILVDQATDYTVAPTARRPEDVRVLTARIFGFDFGIDHVDCLNACYALNDIDQCTLVGIRYGKTDGGLELLANWIALTGPAALYGIYGNAQPSGGVYAVPIIGNTLTGNGTIALQSVGILIDTNQHEAEIIANTINGFQNADIYINAARRQEIRRNTCLSTAPAASIKLRTAKHFHVGENYVQKPIDASSGTNQQGTFGPSYGAVSTLLEGKCTILAGTTSVAVTYGGLPGAPPNFNSAMGCSPVVTPRSSAAVNLGNVWASAITDSGFTMNVEVAPPVNTDVRFLVSSYMPGY